MVLSLYYTTISAITGHRSWGGGGCAKVQIGGAEPPLQYLTSNISGASN